MQISENLVQRCVSVLGFVFVTTCISIFPLIPISVGSGLKWNLSIDFTDYHIWYWLIDGYDSYVLTRLMDVNGMLWNID